jgi:hypothetical protein
MVDMNGPIGLQVTVTSSFNSRVCDAIQSHANYGKRYSTAWNDVARAVYAIIRTSRRVAASCAVPRIGTSCLPRLQDLHIRFYQNKAF